MNRIQRGRGGWAIDVSGLTRAAGVALLVLGLAIGGCSSKKNTQEGAGLNPNPNGLGASGIGSGGGSSLNAMQNGTLGANGGPLGDIHFVKWKQRTCFWCILGYRKSGNRPRQPDPDG